MNNGAIYSDIEREFRQDPSHVYADSDNRTRWMYHMITQSLAQRSRLNAAEIARRALERAKEASRSAGARLDVTHIGYYLIGKGAEQFAKDLGATVLPRERLLLWVRRHTPRLFPLLLGLAAGALLIVLIASLVQLHTALVWSVLTIIVAIPLALRYAAAFARVTAVVGAVPTPVARLDVHTARVANSLTLVVIPTVVASAEEAELLLARLARLGALYSTPCFRFALLSDFADASVECRASDGDILQRLRDGVHRLNRTSGVVDGDRYFVLHRRRVWSPTQRGWIAWERKRGKLLELCRLLSNSRARTTFSYVFGDLPELLRRGPVSFIITLDDRAWMDPAAALDLVRTAAHPLNRPVIDEPSGTLLQGFAIFQPRPHFIGSNEGFGSPVPATPQPRQTGGGSYQRIPGVTVHKGLGALYDVRAVSRLLDNTFPEERVLQHDLLDGFVAGTVELSDIVVTEPLPGNYITQLRRGHRWLRGTFQALPWLLCRTKNGLGERQRNPLSCLQRLFILDLAAEELSKPAGVLLLVLGWTVLPGAGLIWTLVACPSLLAGPIVALYMVTVALTHRIRAQHRDHTSALRFCCIRPAQILFQTVFSQIVLALEAVTVVDALVRTAWRLSYSHHRLLDWAPHRTLYQSTTPNWHIYRSAAWPSAFVGALTICLVVMVHPQRLAIASPYIIGWIAAPWILLLADRFIWQPVRD